MPEASAAVPEKKLVSSPSPVELPATDHVAVHHRIKRDVNEFSPTLCNEVECKNPYASFAPKPVNVHFETQDSSERVLLFVRKHWITNVGWLFTALVLAFLPIFLRFIPIIDFFPERFHLIILLAWYLFILGYVLEKFLSWFFNVNIITDERIIDIDFYSLLYKRITSAQIERIEDVTNSVSGFLGSVLNYGTVDIQTAAEEREISFELIPNPEKVTKILNELIIEEEQEKLDGRAR